MIVQFDSTETAEILMFAETAKLLLDIIGKESTARGVITQPEMREAAARLQAAVDASRQAAAAEPEDEDAEARPKEVIVGLSQRAWPLIDMLQRTAHSGPEAHVVWRAASDF
ncbi:MAG: DUF1840 domain-containing protein [Azonexus sp.]|nr:DUF1840 domain-containing protein [Azonexus sp.]